MTQLLIYQDRSHGRRGLLRFAPQPPAFCIPGQAFAHFVRSSPLVERSTPRCNAESRGLRPPAPHRPLGRPRLRAGGANDHPIFKHPPQPFLIRVIEWLGGFNMFLFPLWKIERDNNHVGFSARNIPVRCSTSSWLGFYFSSR